MAIAVAIVVDELSLRATAASDAEDCRNESGEEGTNALAQRVVVKVGDDDVKTAILKTTRRMRRWESTDWHLLALLLGILVVLMMRDTRYIQ